MPTVINGTEYRECDYSSQELQPPPLHKAILIRRLNPHSSSAQLTGSERYTNGNEQVFPPMLKTG
jgi:hypothetical protein